MKQSFEPADQLGLRDAQLGVRWLGVFVERQGQAIEFLAQLRGQTVFEFPDAGGVDLAQPLAAGVVERCGPHLFE